MDRTDNINKLFIVGLSLCWCWLFWAPLVQAGWIDPMLRPSMKASAFDRALWLDLKLGEKHLVMTGAHGLLIESATLEPPFTWHQSVLPVSVTLTALADHPNYRLVVGQDGLILRQKRSTDAPQEWTTVLSGFEANQSMLNDVQAELAQETVDEVTREALTWIEEDLKQDIQRLSTKPFLDIEILDARLGRVLAVGAYGMAFLSENGGLTWQSHSRAINNPERYHLNQLLPLGNGRWLIVGEQGLLRVSDDLGQHWSSLQLEEMPSSWFAAAGLDKVVLVTGIQGHYAFSQDQGVTWKTGFNQTLGTPLYATACYKQWFCLFGRRGRIQIAAMHADGLSILGQWQLPERSDITRAVKLGAGWLLALEKGFVVWQLPSAKEWLQNHQQPLEVPVAPDALTEDRAETDS
jgi:photosystem II stability/assembly factor-like uncharacterized protein